MNKRAPYHAMLFISRQKYIAHYWLPGAKYFRPEKFRRTFGKVWEKNSRALPFKAIGALSAHGDQDGF